MDLGKEKLEIQAVRDERDLKVVVVLNYVCTVLYALCALVALGGAVAGVLGIPFFLGFSTVFGIALQLVSVAFFSGLAYANWLSAKAISARENAIFSTYIAGVNTCVSFPIGLLIGGYSWRVLSRPSVQDMYHAPLRGAPPLETKKSPPKAKPQVRLVTASEQPASQPTMNFDEAMAHADAQEEAMWKKIEEEHHRRGIDEE